jgi:hypothetical protein
MVALEGRLADCACNSAVLSDQMKSEFLGVALGPGPSPLVSRHGFVVGGRTERYYGAVNRRLDTMIPRC